MGQSAAVRIAELGLGEDAILAAGLYPLWQNNELPEALETEYRALLPWSLMEGISRLRVMDELNLGRDSERPDEQIERVRMMLLAMVEDARVVVIKLCYQLHELETAKRAPEAVKHDLAQQTLDIYAPLASRLGIWQLKWQLEDLSLRYLQPETYHKVAKWLDERRQDREQYIQRTIQIVQNLLDEHHIKATVTGRPKHIYSIWRKLETKGMSFNALFDVRAVRVLVDDVASCYAALGVIHGRWQPIPGQFDDYIASPKENYYQSLHTAVIGPGGRTLEVQIRTHEMHEQAEFGVAAHWRYKEGAAGSHAIDDKIKWLRHLLETSRENSDAGEFLEQFQSEILYERVYVITPHGDVVDLPNGATALDFAYAIHTDVGHRCRGARVNGAIAPLTRKLNNGDRVEIITAKEPGPSRNWLVPQLGYLTSSRARSKVRQWFKHEDFQQNLTQGRALLDRELERLGIRDIPYQDLAERFGYSKLPAFLAAIGSGDITTNQIAGRLQQPAQEPHPSTTPTPYRAVTEASGIHVQGVGRLLTTMARCCRPVPPEPIVGYITQGRGITVHRSDCRNLLRLTDTHPGRIVEVSWGDASRTHTYPVTIRIEAYDRSGLLRDITVLLANEKVNVLGANTLTDKDSGIALMDLTLEIQDIPELSGILNRISRFPNVMRAQRKIP